MQNTKQTEQTNVVEPSYNTVYRIEHKESGLGNYRSGESPFEAGYSEAVERHPLPYDDSLLVQNGPKGVWGNLDIRQEHFFGFSSKEQLRSWLYEDVFLINLHDKGFVLKLFIVPSEHFFLGHTQVIFVRQEAISSTEHSLLKYFNLSRKVRLLYIHLLALYSIASKKLEIRG